MTLENEMTEEWGEGEGEVMWSAIAGEDQRA